MKDKKVDIKTKLKAIFVSALVAGGFWMKTNQEVQYQNDEVLNNMDEMNQQISENNNKIPKEQLNEISSKLYSSLETSHNENYELIVNKIAQAFKVNNEDVSLIENEDSKDIGISVNKNGKIFEYKKQVDYNEKEQALKEEDKVIKELPQEIGELLEDYMWLEDKIADFDNKKEMSKEELEKVEKEAKVIREYYVDCKDMIVKVSSDGAMSVTSFTKESKQEKREKIEEEEKDVSEVINGEDFKLMLKEKSKTAVVQLNVDNVNKHNNKESGLEERG